MDKKFIFIGIGGLLVVAVLVIILVTGKHQTTTVSSMPNTLVVWDYNNEKAAYDPVITGFQQAKNVKVQYIVKNPSSYFEDTVNAMAAGTGPDVWIVPANILPQYKDKLTPMPNGGFANSKAKLSDVEAYQNLYPPVVSQDNIYDNKIYGVPLSMDTLKLYVNTALTGTAYSDYYNAHRSDSNLSQLATVISQPQSWDDIVTADKIITTRTGDKITRSAIALGTSSNIPAAQNILTTIMLQDGVKMVSDDLSIAQFHTSQNLFGGTQFPGTKALEFYTSFADRKSPNYTWDSSMPDARRAFAQGKVAMLIDFGSAAQDIKNISPNLNYQVLNLPQINETRNPINMAKYDTLVVPKSSKIPGAAWRFILMATGSDYVTSYNMTIGKKSVYKNIDAQVTSCQTWYNPDTTKVAKIFNDMITQVNDGKDAQTALDGAAGQVTSLLGKLKQP